LLCNSRASCLHKNHIWCSYFDQWPRYALKMKFKIVATDSHSSFDARPLPACHSAPTHRISSKLGKEWLNYCHVTTYRMAVVPNNGSLFLHVWCPKTLSKVDNDALCSFAAYEILQSECLSIWLGNPYLEPFLRRVADLTPHRAPDFNQIHNSIKLCRVKFFFVHRNGLLPVTLQHNCGN